MSLMQACRNDDPMLVGWLQWQQTDEYRNVIKWLKTGNPEYLWGAWMAGYLAATERAAMIHESVNPASDDERHDNVPGAGAMGAVVQYRDLIRKREGV